MNNDLISRSALRKNVNSFFDSHNKGLVSSDLIKYAKAVDDFIDNAPTVERIVCRSRDWSNDCTHSSSFEQGYTQGYEEGKNDRPKGKWIEGEYGNIKCNRCGCEIIYSYLIGNKSDFPKFCCDCGADMRGEE